MGRYALLVGISNYTADLNPLPSAVKDVEALRQVLVSPEMGGFSESDVTVLKDVEKGAIETAIYHLFANRKTDDLLIFYFSGHGVTDSRSDFYLTGLTTRKDALPPTAVSSNYVHGEMNKSRSKRQVIILDCCHSGAFPKGMAAKGLDAVNVLPKLGGEGRAILTASDSSQYAFEQEGFELSLYTHFLVEGLRGAADRDGDGEVSVDELYDYVREQVRIANASMSPEFYPVKEGHRIVLAKAVQDDPKLKFRKEVETVVTRSDGKISKIADRLLAQKSQELGVETLEAEAIIVEVLRPYIEYAKKLETYEQDLRDVIAEEFPFSQNVLVELQELENHLGLREADVSAVKERLIAPKSEEIELLSRQREEEKHQQEETERINSLDRYKQEFAKAIQVAYPFDEYVRYGLSRFQKILGLSDKDIELIERPFIEVQEESFRQKQGVERINKLEKYKKEFAKGIQASYPLDEYVRHGLNLFQKSLGLSDKDVALIERPLIEIQEVAYRQKQAEIERVRQQQAIEVERLQRPQAEADLLRQQKVAEADRLKRQQEESEQIKKKQLSKPSQNEFEFEVIKVVSFVKEGGLLGIGSSIKVELDRKKGKVEYIREGLGNGVSLDLVRIPTGKFMMGSNNVLCPDEKPIHEATLKKFWMGKYSVTNAQWKAVMGTNPSGNYDVKFQGENQPVVGVSWEYGKEFCKKASEIIGKSIRLPSETEWEYACSAGTTTPFHFGETITPELVNYNPLRGVNRGKTVNVDSFSPNAWGLYQMHGNVWEWCEDVGHDNYKGIPQDGSPWLKDGEQNRHVLRGGSWNSFANFCRSAGRLWYDTDGSYDDLGFRVVI